VSHAVTEGFGWAATFVFVGSYFFERPTLLRLAQMAGALLWLSYGLLIHSLPVIVANTLVFSAAGWTMLRKRRVETA
jgi:Bacterial inner membrane protein